MLKEGNKTVQTQTGKLVAGTVKSSGSDMTIHFNSDYQGTRKGFNIIVQYVLAGKINKNESEKQLHPHYFITIQLLK